MRYSTPSRSLLIFVLSSILGALLIPHTAAAADEHTQQSPLLITLEKAVALALANNRDVIIAGEDQERADAQVNEAWSGALPQFSASGQYTRNIKKPVLFIPANTPLLNPTDQTVAFEIGSSNAYQAGFTLSQPLFSLRVGTALSIAHTYRDFTAQSYQNTQQVIIREVKKSFYLVLLAQKLVEANRQGLEVVKANYENIQSQYNHGMAAEFDLLRANVQLANTEPMVISAENNYALAVNALKTLLTIPLEQEIVLQGEFTFEEIPQTTLEQARADALTTNTTIIQLALQEDLFEKNISIERAGYYPTLNLIGGYIWQAQDNTWNFDKYNWAKMLNFGLNLSIPLFDGFKTSARVQQAIIDHEKIHTTRLKVEEGLKIQIQSAELRMAEAKKRIAGQEKNIEQAKKAVHIAQTRFSSGVGTQLELLDAQVAMTRAQTNYAQAIYDYLVAQAEWQYAVGVRK